MENKKKPSLVGRLMKWAGILVAIGACVFGVILWMDEKPHVYTNDAFLDGYRSDISPDILGRIVEMNYLEGQPVKKGEVMAVLLQDILKSERDEAVAQIKVREDEILNAKALLEKVHNDYVRALKSREDRIISEQDFDHKEKDFHMAEANYQKSLSDKELADKKLEVIDTYLHHTYIYAPCDGIVSKRWVYLGDVLNPGQSIYSVYNTQDIWVQANLSEKKIRKIGIGSKAEVYIDAYPGVKFEGEVFAIFGAAASQFSVFPPNNATGNYTKVAQRIPIKISITPPQNMKHKTFYLFPGMNAEVKVFDQSVLD